MAGRVVRVETFEQRPESGKELIMCNLGEECSEKRKQ